MPLIQDGMTYLAGALLTVTPANVTYQQGATSVALVGWQGRTKYFRNQTDNATALVIVERDYGFRLADFQAALPGALPIRGDKITETLGGITSVYEVIAPEEGQPCWQYDDIYKVTIRVHVKRVT